MVRVAVTQQGYAEAKVYELLQAFGLDMGDDHLQDTPRRVAAMFMGELFRREEFEFTVFPAESESMIVVKDIAFNSVCAHHLVPFRGVGHIGYIPGPKMVGLSKLARVLDYYSHAPQVQERLTEQVADYLLERLQPTGLGVVLEAEHMCMAVRGVHKPGATTVTSALRGAMLDKPEARAEFMQIIGR